MSFLKNIVTKIFSQRVIAPAASRIIFVYHDVSETDSPQYSELYSTTPQRFKEQINFIEKNFKIVSLDEIVSLEAQNGKRLAAITFDDGFKSVKEVALPFLEARGIPFTIFANSTAIKENFLPYDQFDEINRKYETRVYLDADEIKELHEAGVIIGNHTANHRTLSDCDDDELQTEVGENKNFLEDLIGVEVAHLAIPYGKREHYDQKSLDFCRETAGHKFIYSTNPVYFKGSQSATNASGQTTAIPRIGLTDQTAEELCFLINRPLIKKIDI